MTILSGNTEVIIRWRRTTGHQVGGQVQSRLPGDQDVMLWKIAKRLVESGTVDFISIAESLEEMSDERALGCSPD